MFDAFLAELLQSCHGALLLSRATLSEQRFPPECYGPAQEHIVLHSGAGPRLWRPFQDSPRGPRGRGRGDAD